MPTYDYRCAANGRTVEVLHRMHEHLSTWGELCDHAGIDSGDTPRDMPVTRMATGGQIISRTGSKGELPPSCSSPGACCSGGMCGLG